MPAEQRKLDQVGLTLAPPGRHERAIAVVVILSSVVTFGLLAPFARTALPRIDGFIPAYESALAINDFITAILLFGQFSRTGSRALLVLACGYLFDVLVIIPHALTFPGVFAPQGLLGAGPQTTAWLYCFWHGGFALFVVAYAVLAGRQNRNQAADRSLGVAMVAGIAATAILAIVLTLLATAGHDLLPAILSGGDYSMLVTKGISPAICAVSLIALGFLWSRRNVSNIDLWLFVVMCAWLCDVMLSAIVGSSRYDLGWYGGRTYGLLAASCLLVILLWEFNNLHDRLAQALAIAGARNVELAKSREQLAHAQRLEAMGQLTGGVAHDFNNLLMIITGSLDIILRSPENVTKVKKFAHAALEATARGAKLTQQLLTFARKQVSRPINVNPNRLLSELEPLLQGAVGADIHIVSKLSPVLYSARLDATQFEAAILNLVVNARDVTASGGRISIETANVTIDAHASDQDEIMPGDYVMVAVTDTGTGMTPEVLTKAFDPFFTTKGVGRGSGLGLSQVYGFSKSFDGHVRIDSKLGIGTTVKLYFPKSLDQPPQVEMGSNVAPLRTTQGNESILVVEDDEEVLELATDGLKDMGYRVRVAANAIEALEILRCDDPVDVLFSDVIMPGGMNGAQLAIEGRRIRPGLKVLLTSGYTAQALVLEHGLPDNLEVLGKPYRYEELANKMRAVISG